MVSLEGPRVTSVSQMHLLKIAATSIIPPERMCINSFLIKTCLLSVAPGFLSPTADSTTTCVMYSFRASERQFEKCSNSPMKTVTTSEHGAMYTVPGATASPSTDEQLLQETSASRRQGFWTSQR